MILLYKKESQVYLQEEVKVNGLTHVTLIEMLSFEYIVLQTTLTIDTCKEW